VRSNNSWDFQANQPATVSRNIRGFDVHSQQRYNHNQNNYMSSQEEKELTIYGCLCLCGTGLLLMVILLPLSFGSLREEELGFKKSTVSQVVDFDDLYCCGHYHVGPTHKFAKVNRHIHTVDIRSASAWTCPAAEDGSCIYNSEEAVNSTANEIGQTMTSSFSVNFRIFTDIDNVHLAYEKYQFDDSRVRTTVANLATENAKQTPQQFSVEEILNATSDELPQVVVDTDAWLKISKNLDTNLSMSLSQKYPWEKLLKTSI